MSLFKVAAACAALGAALPALAQPRPDESSMFGGDAPADGGVASPLNDNAAGDAASAAAGDRPIEARGTGGESDRDASALGGPSIRNQFDTEEAKSDPLKVGGLLYLRAQGAVTESSRFKDIALSAPTQLDAFLDARPSDRVRGLVLARLHYDPTLDGSEPSAFSALPSSTGSGSVIENQLPSNPSIALDQIWVRFDIARTVFVTAGKQHVKWGASRFWNPTDFLTPQRKDPLAVLDTRLGANMVKFHLPWEAKGWNFYALGLLDNAGPANTLGELGAAGRAEVVLGHTELGADAVVVHGRTPRYGFDLSTALGPVDLYGEAALRSGQDFQVWRVKGEVDPSLPVSDALEQVHPKGAQVQASGGARTTVNYTESRALTIGGEYFYNPVGANTALLYPWLILQNQYTPFYAGQHYAALYALAAGLPGNFTNVSMALSTLGNLTDWSFITRLDVFVLVLSYLNVEAFGAVHYGARGGEFRFGLDLPSIDVGGGQFTSPLHLAAPSADFGLGVRIAL